jgi:RNA polymerase sigma-70 factor, ECF subfamily
MAAEPTDEELVGRILRGDREAEQTLCGRHAEALRALARRRLSPAVRRKVGESDVIQEAYLTAFARLRDFEDRGSGSFLAWVKGIVDLKAREAARQYAGTNKRAVGREVTRGARGDTNGFPGPFPPPSQEAMGREAEALLKRAVAQLPEDYRTVLRLVYEEGRTFDDVAPAMGRSRDAVRVLYGRALARLSELYFGGARDA